ncbi:MAG TPA: response regulator transcription factor [Blastocatellia bacterium]|nr:response regulator transcription factor [Blastocatellia bacterium]
MSHASPKTEKKHPRQTLRIILADDHTILRQGLRALIDAQPDMQVVAEASNGIEALEATRRLLPDVVVMDIGMPEMDGAQATDAVKRELPQTKVLALTVQEDTGYLSRMLKAGASGYVLKRAAADDLINAIRIVAEGGHYLDPELATRFVADHFSQQVEAKVEKRPALSKREQDVMRMIAWGYTNKEIAAELRISVKTVETYKARLMVKLDLRSRVDIVRYALRQGWLDEPEPRG